MSDWQDKTVKEVLEAGGEVRTPSRVKRDKAFKEYKRYQEIEDKRLFAKANDKGVRAVVSTINLTQAGVLLGMIAYVNDSEGNLYFEGKKIGTTELAKLLGVAGKTVRRNVTELENLGYVRKYKEGRKVCFAINPQLAHRGEREMEGFFSKVYLVRLRSFAKVATLQELGMIFFMIPYFNTQYYVLCKTPYEMDIDKIELFNREEFAEEVGLSYDRVKKLINKLLKHSAIVGIKTCRTAIVISPRLVSRNHKPVTIDEITEITGNALNSRAKKEW